MKKETHELPTPKRVAVSVHHFVRSFHSAALIMADSTVGSGVFSTAPEFYLPTLGKAGGRLSFPEEVNGAEAPTHSITREAAYLSGDGPYRIVLDYLSSLVRRS